MLQRFRNPLRNACSVPAATQIVSRFASNYGSIDSPLVNPQFIDTALTQLLKNKKTKKTDVHQFIEHFKLKMNKKNFISILNECGKRQMLEPRHIYTAACGLKYVEDSALNLEEIGQIFHSIAYLSHRTASVKVLLTVTAERLEECNESMSVEQVSQFMFSLLNMKSGVPEVQILLEILMKNLAVCEDSISNDNASKLIGGFCGLSSKYPIVRSSVAVVLDKLKKQCDKDPFSDDGAYAYTCT